MTAIISILQRNSVSLITDSAGYNSAGEIVGFYHKAKPIGGLRAAVATRGAIEWPQIIATELADRFDSVDAILADDGAAIREIYGEQNIADGGERNLDLYFVGWSEALDAPVHRFLTSLAGHGVGTWQWVDIDDPVMVAPLPDARSMIKAKCRALASAEAFDPVVDGVRTMTAQRYMRHPTMTHNDGNEVHTVGGDVLLTAVTRQGVEQRVIHRWDDEIGRKIEPFGEAPVIVTTVQPGMSRQQRRAAERAAMKSLPNVLRRAA